MIYTEPFRMSWRVPYSEIQNDEVVEVKGIPIKEYNPFDYYEKSENAVLYRKFISIDENSNDAILEFVRSFGFLGLNNPDRVDHDKEVESRKKEVESKYIARMVEREHHQAEFFLEKIDYIVNNPITPKVIEDTNLWIKRVKNPELSYSFLPRIQQYKDDDSLDDFLSYATHVIEDKDRPLKEKLCEIKKEIIRMKLILKLWDSMSFKDVQEIDRNTLTLWTFDKDEQNKEIIIRNFKSSVSYEVAVYWAKFVIISEVNKQIVHVRPYLLHGDKYELNSTISLKGQWYCPDLLSAMYMMIYMDFVEGKMIRKCRNETCPKWFEIYGNDDRKIYCDSKCANTQAKRASRRMKKERGQ